MNKSARYVMSPERRAALLADMNARYPRDVPIVRKLDKLPEPPPRPPKPVLPDCRGMTVGELEDVLRDFPRDAFVMLESEEDGRADLDIVSASGHPAGNSVVVLYGVEIREDAP